MMMVGAARLGRDAEVKTVGSDSVCNLSLAYNYGKKGADGKRPSVWIDAALWGKRAEALAPFLKKGQQHVFALDDLRMEEYEGKNGKGVSLRARVVDVTLMSNGKQDQQSSPPPSDEPESAAPADDDIPF